MSKGKRYPPESTTFVDEQTGATIRQLTSAPAIHHHPFFMIPAYDDAMKRVIFASDRTGSPQLFAEIRATGELMQLTDRDDLDDWSIHPSHDGRYVYFTAGTGGWRIDLKTLVEEKLMDLAELTNDGSDKAVMKEEGMVAAAMGTTALSRCDRYWAVKFKVGDETSLAIVDTQLGQAEVVLRRDVIAHLQFCPDDPNLLYYAGPLTDRVWAVQRDGRNNRRLYARRPGQWLTHESWIPNRRELAVVDWPKGIFAVHADSGDVRQVTTFNAWHAICNRAGTQMVADTNFPDIGLQLFNPLDSVGEPTSLCYPESSSVGAHWNGPFPYEDGPIKVYAPQHTHPHPSFSPDGRSILYTSDRSGHAQLYEVECP